ncbi:glutathione S-transferase family protein [Reyranella sp. CPCC 100927]|uniref:glutathione S-transferase family protein n=1 Tax=Reyranella sp. CPCC 100927 TaxID=2599616 RepID=UPI0011B7B9D9|nr:glutathione S-transferase family protein [Reyranella sp. CPCC 100927]TWT09709.1 glutathione S-transferase family protein [Reyranella sp. CPCC 100927]
MAQVKIYGSVQSRAARALWCARECGIEFEHLGTDSKALKADPEFARINPNGKVPAMVDGDVTLFESMAINLYLAHKYGKSLWPTTIGDEARTYQWSFWGMTEVEKPLLTIVIDTFMTPADKKNPKAVEDAKTALQSPLSVLNQALKGKSYLLGDTFTIADLNLAAIMAWAKLVKLDMTGNSDVANWLDRCLSRPAFRGK